MAAYRKNSKSLMAEIDSAVKDSFKAQLLARGQIQSNAVNAAIQIWMALPLGAQATFMGEPIPDILGFLRSILCPSSGDPNHV